MAKKTWQLDSAHSEISFSVKHLMITNVRGTFKSFEAKYDGKTDCFVSIHADTVDTGNESRDNHLKGPEFFDVLNNPRIEFTVTELKGRKLSGQLTIKGQTVPVEFKVRKGKAVDAYGTKKIGFSVEGSIKRSEFGLTWNAPLEAGGVTVSDEVKVAAEVQFVKA